MFSVDSVLASALETIRLEAESVSKLADYINASFAEAVRVIHEAKGRVVVSGIGKSAVIAQKMVATFNSTGTPSLFMHAADAIHGDLGMIQPDDVAIVISKSGNSPEIKVLVPLIKNFGNSVISICGNEDSFLAKQCDIFLNTTVEKEACPNNLAPTTSTTAQMVMGDALAVCLLNLKGFTDKDFARYHPGGALGKRLYLRVSDMSDANEKPVVSPSSSLREVIYEISGKRLGATAVIDEDGQLKGIITDGDLRRMLEKYDNPAQLKAADILSAGAKSIDGGELATEALALMRKHDISQLIVTKDGKYAGILHIHDLVREGII
ncbi:D-arabinose 5-phosphate isomerase [Flavipsychrobacter stenotrophus]|uniref:D-arabinose 5-phosphate isomerase n=1 Tax=Flavipsychrobacter stenotrophus TaxID=2077091 RepID=A0A2S7SUK9_9BACT|nr:KpsF/GutQ family sugar-phosphate isomerase [Flavipsychrobacter stenotrophus]PQJ10600.1 D-arabinose 5-phosphate isomerase [Flavipsychrobacter stenotrophus]